MSGKNASLRSNSGRAQAAPIAIDEELWFGAHDHAVAEDTAARSMAALVGRIIGAKPFPVTARRLADLTRQDVVRIEPVIQVLETDPGLSARLLRLVNSAGYALRQRCTSVRHAATLVGTDRLHQIATTAAVLDLFDSKGPAAAQIIEHSTVVGAFCRYLGAHLALPVDDLFTAGFLHDIGKLMLMETENEQYVELLSKCSSCPDSIHHLERALYGFDHAVLAAHVLTAWNIPDPVPKIVAWHHEPAQAYKVSSMMAALVQTVRLSDALVYVMQSESDRERIKELAQHEAASYLDISEPQLAAMWDELSVLYHESHEQCVGENAPALDPRSLRPKRPITMAVDSTPSERTLELPKQFPCVECGCPTFGNTCPACGGYVCPNHQVGRDAWCALCARDYRSEKSSMPVPMPAKWAFGALSGAVVVSGAAGMLSAGSAGALRAGFGTLLLGSLVTLLYVVGKQWFIRSRFVRSRPNRFISEALLNDGGTQSLVPPEDTENVPPNHAQAMGVPSRSDGRLVEPLREITIREIGGHESGVASASLALDDVSRNGFANRQNGAQEEQRYADDGNRVRLQCNSLVTLPVPAMTPASQEEQSSGSFPALADLQNRIPLTGLSATPPDDEETQLTRDTLYGPEFERTDEPIPDAAQEAVRPMPTIEIGFVGTTERSASLDQENLSRSPSRSSVPPSVAKENYTSTKQTSVHPLAVLGFKSEAPPETSNSDATLPYTAADQDLRELPTTGEGSGALSEPIEALSVDPKSALSEAPVEPCADMRTTLRTSSGDADSKYGSAQRDLIESLVERSQSRFDDDFEAHVRELVAQRIAEIVAERMLAAFGAGAMSAQFPRSGQGKTAKARAKPKSAPAEHILPDKNQAPSTKRKLRRTAKHSKSIAAVDQDPKRG
jgi:putative nucleotidyltransferase with HDIG domain